MGVFFMEPFLEDMVDINPENKLCGTGYSLSGKDLFFL